MSIYFWDKPIKQMWYGNKQVRPEPGPDIVLKVVTSWANQKIGINKYFNVSNYTIDWWDGTTTTATTTNSSWAHSKTYASAGTYYITLVNPWTRWTFIDTSYWLVPSSWFTGASVWVEYMPSLKDWFGDGASNPWDYFFYYFNYSWALTSLPAWVIQIYNKCLNNFFYRFLLLKHPKSRRTGVAIYNASSGSVDFIMLPQIRLIASRRNTFDWYTKSYFILLIILWNYLPLSDTILLKPSKSTHNTIK